MKEVYGIIRRLGVTSKYKGYYYLVEAVNMVMEQKEEQMRITKDIYPGLSKKFKLTALPFALVTSVSFLSRIPAIYALEVASGG